MNVVLRNIIPLYALAFIPLVGCTFISAVEDPEGPTPPDFDCTPDTNETDANDIVPIQAGVASNNNICPPGDVDLYSFSITEDDPQNIEVILTFNVANDLDLKLFQGISTYPDGTPTIESFGTDSTERIDITPDTSAEDQFLIEVYPSDLIDQSGPQDDGADETAEQKIMGDYTLTLRVTPSPGG